MDDTHGGKNDGSCLLSTFFGAYSFPFVSGRFSILFLISFRPRSGLFQISFYRKRYRQKQARAT